MKKIEKLHLSEKTKLSIAEDINSHFRSATKYRHFLIKHDLLSFDFDGYPAASKLDFFSNTLDEMDESLFVELDKANILSEESISLLLEDEVELFGLNLKQDKNVLQNSSKTVQRQTIKTTPPNKEQNFTSSNQSGFHKTFAFILLFILLVVLVLSLIEWIIPNANILAIVFASVLIVVVVVSAIVFLYFGIIKEESFVRIINSVLDAIKLKK